VSELLEKCWLGGIKGCGDRIRDFYFVLACWTALVVLVDVHSMAIVFFTTISSRKIS